MHAKIFQRTHQGQAAICGESPLDLEAQHLLLRVNGYTALQYLELSGDDVQAFERIAQELLDLGLIDDVGEDPQAVSPAVAGSRWNCLDALVPA